MKFGGIGDASAAKLAEIEARTAAGLAILDPDNARARYCTRFSFRGFWNTSSSPGSLRSSNVRHNRTIGAFAKVVDAHKAETFAV